MRPLAIGTLLVGLVAARPALAEDTFEAKASGATKVARFDDVVWSLTAACDKGDDVHNRQCRVIRDARAKQLAGATLLVEAEPSALDVGKWSAAKKSVAVTLTACIRCTPLELEGRKWYVTGAPARVEAGKLTAANLYDSAKQFSDEASANAWIGSLKSARVQLITKVPDKRRWLVDGKDGLLLDVVGYRVVQPCTGTVLFAKPVSGPAEPDKSACASATDGEVVPALTAAMVQDTMKPVVEAAKACYAKFKVAGKARLELGIASDGTVAAYEQQGAFRGTPTGQCIDVAMSNVQFPPTQKPRTVIGFPIVLP